MMASAQGNLDMVHLLLKKKARPNEQNFRGHTALMKACEKGHLPVIITLLFYGAAIDIKDKVCDRTYSSETLVVQSCNVYFFAVV